MELGMYLREQRKKDGYTQEEVANLILVNQKSISNWENSKTVPDIYNLAALAKLYHFSLDDLLLEGDEIIKEMKTLEERELGKKLYRLAFLGMIIGGLALVLSVLVFKPRTPFGIIFLLMGSLGLSWGFGCFLRAITFSGNKEIKE